MMTATGNREWAIRRGQPRDVPYIMDAWMKTLARSLRRAEKRSDYAHAQKLVIASLLEDSRVYVATGKEDDSLLIGFICAQAEDARKRALLHFIYVTKAYRGAGVARSLLRQFLDHELPEVNQSPQQGGIAVTEIVYPWHYYYAKKRGWSIAPRRGYYHAISKEMARNQEREAG